MGRNFPSRGIRHDSIFGATAPFPWRYPETETRRFRRQPANTFRRRFFVIRPLEEEGRAGHYIFAECPNYPAAMEVAALAGDRVFTEGQMLDHPERRRALTAWDKGDGLRPARLSTAPTAHRQPRAIRSRPWRHRMVSNGNGRFDLTRREQEILECVANGMRNGEIASELHLAESTVKSHLTSAFLKLGVSNRTQAAIATLNLDRV